MNIFNLIPIGFFNPLASGSNNRIYADCLQLIYDEYDRESLSLPDSCHDRDLASLETELLFLYMYQGKCHDCCYR
ncbi:hypothetical protein SAMN06297422_11251 [Lachnospiraceae bacterium]|nr:hypothetical protein SAMN06297422_11251 [Lachnospiraceae bacterium]